MRSIWCGKFPVPKCAQRALCCGGVLLTLQEHPRLAWQQSVAPRLQKVRSPSRRLTRLRCGARLSQPGSSSRMVRNQVFACPPKPPEDKQKEAPQPLRSMGNRHPIVPAQSWRERRKVMELSTPPAGPGVMLRENSFSGPAARLRIAHSKQRKIPLVVPLMPTLRLWKGIR
jgi:hypothetical protein